MYDSRICVQDPSVGGIAIILNSLADLAALPGNQFCSAVAYATLSGCHILHERLAQTGEWLRNEKKWLISIDFGRTEPAALEYLADIANSAVRIPNGLRVVEARGFVPPSVYHTKLYLAKNTAAPREPAFGCFVGSANLSVIGLTTGIECGAVQRWMAPLTSSERKGFAMVQPQLSWFDRIWGVADPVDKILPLYEARWRKQERIILEDETEVAGMYQGGPSAVVEGIDAVVLF